MEASTICSVVVFWFSPFFSWATMSPLLPPPISLTMLIGFFVTLSCSSWRLTKACYVFPPDVKDPCETKECPFGARCSPSLDGRSAECVCPDKCASYGDHRGSTPVCGSDGKDYPHLCELKKAACQSMKEISVKYHGKCGKFHLDMILLVFELGKAWRREIISI